jgi:HAD superfamily hydrolase (TIGR01509 family)
MTAVSGGGDSTSPIEAICFDAFGTLVEITDKRRPFQVILSQGRKRWRATDALKSPLGLRDIARVLAIEIGEARLSELERDLAAECRSIRLRPGIETIWASLRRAGLRIGICSNLALPYAEPLLAVVPGIPDALVLSFEVGLVKPQPEIFHLVCEQLGLSVEQILFVGDSPEADVLGPLAVGMHAMTIRSFQAALEHGSDHLPPTSEQVPRPVRQLLDRLIECACS